jgi:hypothetical protein
MSKLLARRLSILILATFFLVGQFAPTHAQTAPRTYYVDATRGNDQFNGLFESTPLRTVARVNGLALRPGDQVLFRRGQVWRETLRIRNHGTPTSPVIYGAYGPPTEAKPLIDGSDIIPTTSWRIFQGNIYMAQVNINVEPTHLFVNGVPYTQARFPKTGYALATQNSTNATTVTDTRTTLQRDQVLGAKFFGRTQMWSIQERAVQDFNSATKTFTMDRAFDANFRLNFGYYLQNKLWMLTAPGEWVYDRATRTVYVRMIGDGSPASRRVEITAREFGIYTGAYAIVRDMAAAKTTHANVYMLDALNVRIERVDSRYAKNGIAIGLQTRDVQIINNNIDFATANGIYAATPINLLLSNNRVNNSENIGLNIGAACGAGPTLCSDIRIVGNRVTDSGYSGISVAGIRPLIQNNHITRSCLTLDDCGGIYTGSGRPDNPFSFGATITNNIIDTARGVITGTSAENAMGVGIYLDDFNYDSVVEFNTVINADTGINIHNGRNNRINNNQVYGFLPARGGIVVAESHLAHQPNFVRDNIVSNNYVAGAVAGPLLRVQNHLGTNIRTMVQERGNSYCTTHPNQVITTGAWSRWQNMSLAQWQSSSGQGVSSQVLASGCRQAPASGLTFTPQRR